MKSNLSKTEFKARLTELVAEGSDFYFITPYDFSGKPFCGKFDDSTFELTSNSFWRRVAALRIDGEYKEDDSESSEITYEIGWTPLTRNLMIVIVCVGIIGMDVAIIVSQSGFDTPFFPFLLILDVIFGSVFFLGFAISNWVTKKIINQKFKEKFEIGVKDEWASHEDSLIYKRLTKQ